MTYSDDIVWMSVGQKAQVSCHFSTSKDATINVSWLKQGKFGRCRDHSTAPPKMKYDNMLNKIRLNIGAAMAMLR